MATVIPTEQVQGRWDDGFSFNGSYGPPPGSQTQINRAEYFFNLNTADVIFTCTRFVSVPIPQGATIISAVMSVLIRSAPAGDDPEVTIWGDDTDDADPLHDLTPADYLPENRTPTSATVVWSDTNLGNDIWVDLPSITAIIQEIINRPGWVSGNALAIITEDTQSSKTFIAQQASNTPPGTNTLAPKLDVTYSSGGQIMRCQFFSGS